MCLVTYDSYCKWDSICTFVDICPDTATIGFQTHAAGKTISFFDTSSANGYQYNWTFGDGSSGSGKTPTHRYSNDGTYYVCLAMTDSCRTKVYCDSIQVCNDTLVANFGSNISGMNVSFTDSSSNADSVSWDFGDGTTSTALNPSHAYTTPGYYVVCQTVVDYCNSISHCDTIGVCVDTAKAAFSFSNTGLLFNFINTSANANTYAWDFGDGNFSTQQNPTHVYTAHGVYYVCLIITNDCYSDTICQNVAACNLNPVAAYSYQATATPMVIQFNDQSQDAHSFMWDFGDGSSSTNQNPLKAYASKAIYRVCLSITDSCGTTDSTCSSLNLINFSAEESEWLGELKIYPNPTKGLVNVQSEALRGMRLTLQLNDITGRKLFEKEVNTTKGMITIDLTQHPKGLYILKITDGNNMKSIRLNRN